MRNLNGQIFGRLVARLRRKHGWTQRELAERLFTAQSMVAKWETGKVVPRAETLQKLAELLETTVDDLMTLMQDDSAHSAAPLQDSELQQLLGQVHTLEDTDQQALKAVLRAMLTQSRLKYVMHPPLPARQAS